MYDIVDHIVEDVDNFDKNENIDDVDDNKDSDDIDNACWWQHNAIADIDTAK